MIDELLATRDWLLADGATGTNLFAMGLVSGEAPELWNETHPERVQDLHRRFVAAGADIILTNSFGCNRRRLALHKLEARTGALARRAAENARAVADRAGRRVVVAGSVGPTGDLFAPLGALTEALAIEVFAEEIEGLRAGGAEVIWIETMSALEEMRAAALAAARHGMPYAVTASFDTAGNTMMGVTPARFVETVAGFAPAPCAAGANCGVGASDLLVSMLAMSETAPPLPLIAKANCGIPEVHGSHVHYSGTPALMADYARLARDAGARIIGGCCGTSPEHLAAMRLALEGHRRGRHPDRDRITAAIGPLASPPSRADAAPRRRGRRPR
ncbi:MAG TPA: betaine--homocysteine S-methyltransferase [Alphaproteobacteria bacterium]|nr:betaine--homocysteine S-methyltransferase [Alphaproteobacteria bacterium]